MRNPIYWSLVILRRHLGLFLILSFLLSSLVIFIATQIQISAQKTAMIEAYEKFPFDLVAPKGSDVELLQNLLMKSQAPEAYLPSNLFNSLKNGPVNLIGFLRCGETNNGLQCGSLSGSAKTWLSGIDHIAENETYISKQAAARLSVRVGDELKFTFKPDGAINTVLEYKFKVVGFFDSEVSAFENFAIVSDEWNQKQYAQITWSPDQIWNSGVLNLIFVSGGSAEEIHKLEEIINKRTVSSFIHSQKTLHSAMNLFDIKTSLQKQNLQLGVLASVAALFLALFFIRIRLREFLLVTSRLGFTRKFQALVMFLSLVYCIGAGSLIYSIFVVF